jgi:hypothetical protein
MNFKFTPKQVLARRLLGSKARHILLRGGSRSGKTFVLGHSTIIRAIKAPGSTHCILRYRFNHLKDSVINDTMPKIMKLCFPEVSYEINKSDWFMGLPNGSRILFGGLDDKQRTEKILGQEHSTIWLNEISQISYSARNTAITRLAQRSGLKLKAYYDCNPPGKGHWSYKLWFRHIEPTSGIALVHPDAYDTMQMNPIDNLDNIGEGYEDDFADMPERDRIRYEKGEYAEQLAHALWTYELLDNRVSPNELPTLVSICVAVDPSGCEGEEDERSDEIGIVVCGKDAQDRAYILEDLSGRYSPERWARIAVMAYYRWEADAIVAERNFGGAMVGSTIRQEDNNVPVEIVTASRGKHVRAQPVAALSEKKRLRLAGHFSELEEQLLLFDRSGYQGSRSPDRGDAAIWGVSWLFFGEEQYGMTRVVR